MRKVLPQILILTVVVIVVWIAGEWYGSHEKKAAPSTLMDISHAVAAPVSSVHAPANHPVAPLMAANEWPKFVRTRQAALKADPSLDTEYKQILKKMTSQQAELDAAMVKADPQIKSVLAKLVVLRQKNSSPLTPNSNSGTIAKPAPPSAPPVALTPDDMQQIRTARAEALQANPNLIANAKTISEQMRDFENKLDAAMIKVDPSVSPIIAKFDGAHKIPGTQVSPSSVK